jgi:pimeloyl-ACP methyl ester carboxylesterase
MSGRNGRWLFTWCVMSIVAAAAVVELAGCGSSSAGNGGGASSGSSNGNGSGNGQPSDDAGDLGVPSGSSGGGGSGNTPSDGGSSSSRPGTSSGDAGALDAGPAPLPSTTCLQMGSGDYSKAGPYQVAPVMSVDLASSLPAGTAAPTTFSVYYPSSMDPSCPHPIAAWGNGTGVDSSMASGKNVYSFYHTNLASWGIVVIAADNPSVGGGPYLKAGIEYLIAQSKVSTSVFYQKLSTRASVAGHSQGGFAATQATQMDSNVVAEVCVEGGGVPKPGVATLCLTGNAPSDAGANSAINSVNAQVIQQTYPGTTGPAFLADWDGGDHETTPTLGGYASGNPGTIQFIRLMTAWDRCYLAGDGNACKLFKGGSSCGICKDPGWAQLASKNM